MENKSATSSRQKNNVSFFAQCFLQSEFTVSRFLRRKRMEHGIRVCGVAYLRRHIWLLDARGKYVMVGCCFGCVSRFLGISAIVLLRVIHQEMLVRFYRSISIHFPLAWMKKLSLSLCCDEYYSINEKIVFFFFFILYKWKIERLQMDGSSSNIRLKYSLPFMI